MRNKAQTVKLYLNSDSAVYFVSFQRFKKWSRIGDISGWSGFASILVFESCLTLVASREPGRRGTFQSENAPSMKNFQDSIYDTKQSAMQCILKHQNLKERGEVHHFAGPPSLRPLQGPVPGLPQSPG